MTMRRDRRAYMRAYNQSTAGKQAQERYNHSEKGRRTRHRYYLVRSPDDAGRPHFVVVVALGMIILLTLGCLLLL
jgi:hypothetical protein